MNILPIVRYITARLQEPSIVHRSVAAIGGFSAAFSLTGPEKWVAMIMSASALIGILLPDSPSQPTGFTDASPAQPITNPPVSQPPVAPTPAPSRPVHPDAGVRVEPVLPADGVRDPVPTRPVVAESSVQREPGPGFNG